MDILSTIVETIKGLPEAFMENKVVSFFVDLIEGTISDVEVLAEGLGSVDVQLKADLDRNAAHLATNPTDTVTRKLVLSEQVELTQKQLKVSDTEARNVVRSMTASYAQSQGIDPKAVLESLTADEQRILNYSHNEQKLFGVDLVTANKLAATSARLSGRLLLTSTVFFTWAVLTLGPGKVEKIGAPRLAGLVERIMGKKLSMLGAAGTFVWSEYFGHLSSDIPMVTKQLIDNGSIGPGLRIKAVEDAEKVRAQLGDPTALLASTIKSSFAQTEKTRITEQKTAKPKLFTGIVYNGQVGKYDQFVRAVDDHITSDADLKSDVEINLLRYISKMPNNLSYSIQIKNSPSDELGIPRTGTWATLSIYLTNQFHKRVFIDEILLGPVDPYVYYPEAQKVEQLQYEIPKIAKFETLHPMDEYRGQERIIDTAGNVITDVLHDGTRVVASAKVSAPEVPLVSMPPVAHVVATPNSISAEGIFQHNQPPLFVNLYRLRNGEVLSYVPYSDLYTQAEKDKLSQDPSKFAGNEQKLKDRGVNTTQIRAVQYLDLEGVGRHPERTVDFAEFFGIATQWHEFPKTVHVVVDKLNIRSEPTSQSAATESKQLVRGDTFTAVALVEGESVNGNNKWYKSSLGHFVWSGGAN